MSSYHHFLFNFPVFLTPFFLRPGPRPLDTCQAGCALGRRPSATQGPNPSGTRVAVRHEASPWRLRLAAGRQEGNRGAGSHTDAAARGKGNTDTCLDRRPREPEGCGAAHKSARGTTRLSSNALGNTRPNGHLLIRPNPPIIRTLRGRRHPGSSLPAGGVTFPPNSHTDVLAPGTSAGGHLRKQGPGRCNL